MFSFCKTKRKSKNRSTVLIRHQLELYGFSRKCYFRGKLHRMSGPAIIYYHDNGTIRCEEWYNNNKVHRINGPAVIHYNVNETIRSEVWYINNKIHRINGPATIYYHVSGTNQTETWYINDKLIAGPYFY